MIDNPTMQQTGAKRGRLQLLLLILIFALPPMAAYVVYYGGWMPSTHSNKGELVEPVQALPALTLTDVSGERRSLSALSGQWVMLAVAGELCDEACQATLYKLRQVRLALGEGRMRVERVLIYEKRSASLDRDALLENYEGTYLLAADEVYETRWLPVLAAVSDGSPVGNVFIIDQQGNLMMRYRPDQEPVDLLTDMRRLLAATRYH